MDHLITKKWTVPKSYQLSDPKSSTALKPYQLNGPTSSISLKFKKKSTLLSTKSNHFLNMSPRSPISLTPLEVNCLTTPSKSSKPQLNGAMPYAPIASNHHQQRSPAQVTIASKSYQSTIALKSIPPTPSNDSKHTLGGPNSVISSKPNQQSGLTQSSTIFKFKNYQPNGPIQPKSLAPVHLSGLTKSSTLLKSQTIRDPTQSLTSSKYYQLNMPSQSPILPTSKQQSPAHTLISSNYGPVQSSNLMQFSTNLCSSPVQSTSIFSQSDKSQIYNNCFKLITTLFGQQDHVNLIRSPFLM